MFPITNYKSLSSLLIKSLNYFFVDMEAIFSNLATKRKLSDMLGPQWSKHELARFYEAYRKYGNDWKKVATFIGSRSIDMVEALYNMNKAYLSLPEGTASVAGLIAMMTDHYNVMGGNGTERDRIEPLVMARKLQNQLKPKVWLESPIKDSSRRQSIVSSDKSQSLLKSRLDGIQPFFPVRKRTPRVAVSNIDVHTSKVQRDSVMNKNQGALVHGSPHLSQSIYSEIERIKTSEVLTASNALSRRDTVTTKHSGTTVGEESAEHSLGSSKQKNGDLARDSFDSSKSAVAEYKKGKKKLKKEEVRSKEAELYYDFTDREQQGKIGFESVGAKIPSTSEGPRHRNKKPLLEDEREACDALQTLAEMSLMMPYLSAEVVEDAGESVAAVETKADIHARPDAMLKVEKSDGGCKKKRKSQILKEPKAGLHSDNARKLAESSVLTNEVAKSADSSGHISAVSKKHKSSVQSPDTSSGNDQQIREADVVATSSEIPDGTLIVTRRKNYRKSDKAYLQKDRSYTHSSSECSSLLQDSAQGVKDKISNCVSWRDVRKWCVYEWFYSAIDYPWFAKREFVEYLNHVGLGHIPRLTRIEWGVIRSSLGKPRRFSERFLQEEREKLKQYRESVRNHYANLRVGLGEGLPTDLARPLSVGQQVIAIHPKTREVHNGSVLTVDWNSCLVQFDRPDLGVESVMDIDCMPVNPLENMPEVLRRQKYLQLPKVNEQHLLALDGHVQNLQAPPCPLFANETKVKSTCTSSHADLTSTGGLKIPSAAYSQLYNVDQMNAMKGDMRPVPGLTESLCREGIAKHNVSSNPSCWPQPMATPVYLNGAVPASSDSMISCQETASNVAEIVDRSRDKAQRMVDIAIKAMSLMKEGDDAFGRIGEALDASNVVQCATTCRVPVLTLVNLPHKNSSNPFTSENQTTGDASGIKPDGGPAANDLQVPSDLIASCVATLLMIQTCTKRQYPPAEVAQILDNAVTSLHPRFSQNQAIYREIQMCMGRIKTQILALVPT